MNITETSIKGMYLVELDVHKDERGWFKENYQKKKLEELGLPEFNPVQNNFSFNKETGVTRGLHAEPWDKFVSLANGKVFGAWVDLRPGDGFGKVYTGEITPKTAFFIPRGVANGYQTLEANITYTYLVNDYWSADKDYKAVNLFDTKLNISWPIPADKAIVSQKDLDNPALEEIEPMEF
jgi:dTDP-4-dehydrorhamnose 3,5-epimerase